jgi:hypothetical protein
MPADLLWKPVLLSSNSICQSCYKKDGAYDVRYRNKIKASNSLLMMYRRLTILLEFEELLVPTSSSL